MHRYLLPLADITDATPFSQPIPVMLAGAVPLVLLAALALWMLARRAHRAGPRPVTQLAMAAPVSRKQITEIRGPQPQLDVLGDAAHSHPLGGSMIRIGRHDENDIQLASQTVHRYHAVLHLTPQQGHVITDLSGPEGNGVIVNGARVEQAALTPGDMIELGDVRMRFRMGEAH